MSTDSSNTAGESLHLEPERGKRISLVLSSGGARGLAHIGVIRELEARGYHIEAISGSSMGALVGGLYALGKMEAFADWAAQLDRSSIFRLLDVTTSPGGFIAGGRIMEQLAEWIGDDHIQDLPIKFTAVAVDIEHERELWMSEGSLYDAVRASISIPGVFTPHKYRGRLLVDGGVLNPLPVAPSLDKLTDQTFVVDANGPPTHLLPWQDTLNLERDKESQRPSRDSNGWLRRTLYKMGGSKLGSGAEEKTRVARKIGVTSVLLTSMDMMQAALTRQQLAVFNPSCVFQVPRNVCLIHEFHRAEEIIAIGHKVAVELLDRMEQ